MKVILACLAGAVAAAGQTTVTTRQVDLSGLARGVVDQTRQARHALAGGDKDAALVHVNRAAAMARDIQSAARGTGLDTGGKLSVPIYTERETETTYTPVKRGKGEMSAGRLQRDTNVRQVTAQTTRASLDVTAALDLLTAARTALDGGDYAAAQAALGRVERQAITIQSGTRHLPLLSALENLDLARARVAEGKYKDARMPLKSAAQALADYQRTKGSPRAESAGIMRTEMDAYADRIGRDHSDAARLIENWYDTVRNWYTAMTE